MLRTNWGNDHFSESKCRDDIHRRKRQFRPKWSHRQAPSESLRRFHLKFLQLLHLQVAWGLAPLAEFWRGECHQGMVQNPPKKYCHAPTAIKDTLIFSLLSSFRSSSFSSSSCLWWHWNKRCAVGVTRNGCVFVGLFIYFGNLYFLGLGV